MRIEADAHECLSQIVLEVLIDELEIRLPSVHPTGIGELALMECAIGTKHPTMYSRSQRTGKSLAQTPQ
jgi:hypothetical protein